MDNNKKYWKGLEELNSTPEFVEKNKHEFAEPIPIEDVLSGSGLSAKTPRRDFLKALGFGVGAVTLAACTKVPVHKSIPYLIKPEEVTPGVANFYVSSFEGQPILVKTREGRPIKIEGNPADMLTKGGISAQGQASVLDLYNSGRLQQPKLNGSDADWAKIDEFVKSQLSAINAGGKKIRLVTSTVYSPSTLGVIADFIAAYPAAKHINYDSISYTGIIQANQNSFGKAVIPSYKFDKADVIVSFGADFLGTWISGEEFTLQYVSNRNAKSLEEKKMSRHIQFETGMSMTGTNADNRYAIKASQQGIALMNLYNDLSGTTLPGTKALEGPAGKALKIAAKELLAAKGKALVVCGSNDIATQILVNAINSLLGSYGTTIDLDTPYKKYAGNDQEFADFIREMNAGEVDAVFFLNANPAYDYYKQKEFTDALAKVKLKVTFADQEDETAALCNVLAPNNHFLESWGDAEVVEGYYSIIQPTINPVYNTRQAEQSLLDWSDNATKQYYTYVRNTWNTVVFPKAGVSGQKAWETLLQTGFVAAPKTAVATTYAFSKDLASVAQTIASQSAKVTGNGDQVELVLYQNNGVGDGKKANNPWLQEMPDPVSKVTWDNFAAVAEKFGKETLKVEEGDVVEITANGYTIKVPVLFQPGQAQGTVSVALGYGRTAAGKVGNAVGANAYPFYNYANGTFQTVTTATVKANGEKSPLAQTQTHHSYEGRSVIREATFAQYKKNPAAGVREGGEEKKDYNAESLWDEYDRPVYNWVMAIDLNACTGCGACVVACNAENNIPVVGKDEVRRRREMHWIRIDRYYSFNDEQAHEVKEEAHGQEANNAITKEKEIGKAYKAGHDLDNVSVVHQPMMCQHCDHAPCETVCPVLATVHSSEGLNHMAYNRCIGTRYCANNCPFKVRRFNWFNYWNDSRFENYMQNEYTQLVLNPDVTTRFRGVMEKCSMCIQRIQAGKLKAKLEKRPLMDGEVKVACQQTCTANAIIFGNKNDKNSEVYKALNSERTYYVLEELNIQPGIGYQTKIRNVNEEVVSA